MSDSLQQLSSASTPVMYMVAVRTYLRDIMCDAIETMIDYPEPVGDYSDAMGCISKFMLQK